MRTRRAVAVAALLPVLAVLAGPAYAAPITPGGSTEVTVGSNDNMFSQNKQNEPGLAVNPVNPSILAAGANDNIDMEACNAGDDRTCPFTRASAPPACSSPPTAGDLDPADIHRLLRPGHAELPRPADVARSRRRRHRLRPDPNGPIGTLPNYFENGMQSNGDPSWPSGRCQARTERSPGPTASGCTTRTSHCRVPGQHPFPGDSAIAVSRTDDIAGGGGGRQLRLEAPVIVTRQNRRCSATRSRSGPTTPRPARSSATSTSATSASAAPRGSEPVLFARSTDGGDNWRIRQLSAATNNGQTGGRQGCAVRTDSAGVVYVVWSGTDIQTRQGVLFQTRSFNGGADIRAAAGDRDRRGIGQFDPAQGRLDDRRHRRRPDQHLPQHRHRQRRARPGRTRPTRSLVSWSDDRAGTNNERAFVIRSTDGGATYSAPAVAARAPTGPTSRRSRSRRTAPTRTWSTTPGWIRGAATPPRRAGCSAWSGTPTSMRPPARSAPGPPSCAARSATGGRPAPTG